MKYVIMLFFLGLANISFSQKWRELANDYDINLYDVVEEAEIYFKNIDKTKKGSGWKSYQRWLYENEPKYYPSGKRNTISPYFVANQYKKIIESNSVSNRTIFNNGWEELGPYYIEEVTGHYSVGLGRIESFYIDNNPNIIYLGSRSGGFWKTSNGGETWTNTTDDLIATGVNTIAVDPNNPDKILINVRNSKNGTTHGIYKSNDGGDTWTITNFNPDNLNWGGLGTNNKIFLIKYHPIIPDLIFIGTSEGLYRSSDNLISWNQVDQPTGNYRQIDFHPTNSSIVYATKSYGTSNILISNDTGLTFGNSGTITNNNSAIKISISQDCENCIFIGSSDGIWKSTDSGVNFNLISGTYIDEISNYGAFAVSDVNSNVILYGDIDTHMSYNGGANFEKTTFWAQGNFDYDQTGTYVHADIRGAVSIDGVFWVNTDGLLCKSEDNGVTWEIFEGQSIRENYCLGASQSNHYRSIAGSQDNGTSIKNENTWIEFYGADGMEGIIHPLNDDWMIGSLQYGNKRRTKDGGYSQQGINPDNFEGDWVTPLLYDPNNQMNIFTMSDKLYRSDDFGANWTTLSTPFSIGQKIQNAAIAENNSNTIAVSYYNELKITNDGGLTFNLVSQSLPNQFITDIAFDPNDDDTIIVTYSSYGNNNNKVYLSNDQGLTWENITTNLSNMPIRSVVIDHKENSTIYIGAEIGIYKKSMSDNSWELFNENLPNTTVMELEVVYGSNTLRAATWGRGLWEYSLSGRENYPSILTTRISNQPTDNQPKEGSDQFVTSTIQYEGTLVNVYVEWASDMNTDIIQMNSTVEGVWVSETSIPNFPEGSKVFFKVFAESENGLTTETYKFMYSVRSDVYCTPSMDCSFGDGIQLFKLADINNPSGCEGYADFTEISTDLEQGSEYELTITTGYGNQYIKVWIDYNNDLDFTVDEIIVNDYVIEPGVNSPGVYTESINISIPEIAATGQHILRAKTNWAANVPNDSCDETLYGETEDYTVFITEQSLGLIGNNFPLKPSIYPNPTEGNITIDLKNNYKNVSISLHDILGRKILDKNYDQTQNFELTIRQSPGVYFLSINTENKKAVFKLIKN
jgi:photosystem II stability/assembly factor-like uncharacterized protein